MKMSKSRWRCTSRENIRPKSLQNFNMFITKPITFSAYSKNVRLISQFRIPRNDCIIKKPPRPVLDAKACGVRDTGLVLGVYHTEHAARPRAVLTAAADKYDRQHEHKLRRLLELSPTPRLGEYRLFYDVDPKYAYVVVAGLGSECLAFNQLEKLDENREAIRIAAGVGTRALQPLLPKNIEVESFGNAEAAAEGSQLAVWEFKEYRTRMDEKSVAPVNITLYDDCDFQGWHIGKVKAESQNLTRYLQEMPANFLNPTSFAKVAVDLLCELDINVEVKTKGWAAAHEMGGFVAVGRSSVQPPLYVELGYHGGPPAARPVVLIGKGVTFDSGSIDLKPPEELRYMRGDMAGAACVLAVMRAAALLALPLNIRGILPLCEMMPNCWSPKFGNVTSAPNGKTILIRQPAREGRLLVADSLVYARSYWPRLVVDIGTMSQELEHCLGAAACGCYTNSDELFRHLEAASSQTGDRVWRLPLWKFYEDRVRDVETADVANTGRHKYGDSPNCAAFLRQFVCDSEWVHLDTHNVAYTKGRDFAYLGRGMSGRPTRTVIELIHQLMANSKLG